MPWEELAVFTSVLDEAEDEDRTDEYSLTPEMETDSPTPTSEATPLPIVDEQADWDQEPVTVPRDINRYRILQRIRSRWIFGVLKPLSATPLIPLRFQQRPDATANPWRTSHDFSQKMTFSYPEGTQIIDVFDEASGELLILGEAGSGKSTLLLKLTQSLVKRALNDDQLPIPIIFNLPSWAQKRAPLIDWLIEELNLKYQVPVALARTLVTNDQVFPLLDGLDEVDLPVRPACVEAINAYRQEHGLVPLVVCCRSADYNALPEGLVLGNAIVVQPLTHQQIDDYVSRSGEDLAAMRVALQADEDLQEMASTPLMLSILAYSYGDMTPEEAQELHSSRAIVLDQYIERLLRRETRQHYPPEQIKPWLSWLAWQMRKHNQTEFYIERMQPDWLGNSPQLHGYQRTVIRFITVLQCIVLGALAAWLKGGLKNGVVGSGNGILGLFGGGEGNTMMGWMAPGIGGGSQGGASLIIILSIVIWLVTILVGSPSIPTLTPQAIRYGLFSGLRAGFKLGGVISIIGIPFFSIVGGIQHGISYGLGIGFFLGILMGLLRGMGAGLRYEEQQKEPVPAKKASFTDRVIDGLTFGVFGALSFMVVEELLQVSQQSTLIYSCIVFLFFFAAYGFGGGTNLFPALAQTIKPAETVLWSWSHMFGDMKENSKKSVLVALVTGICVSVVIASVTSLFFFNVRYGIRYGLVFGTISGLIVGIAAFLTSMLQSGWSSTILPPEKHTKPNEGILRSGRNALIGACFFAPIGGVASGLACGIGFGLIGRLPAWPVMGMAFAVMLAIMFFVIFVIAHGGIAWIEHYTLRWYFWRAGFMPLRFVRFLETVQADALVRKVGGGYMFTHRLIQEHFARLYERQDDPS
ncbi:hypothetical protein KDW_30640 [Dictyobacter vulcani]|uniref:NACHT domain-containing protein n=2 Tax=Dictyobacter vulcani TaxID=2607529 RepID=A0A5J4KP23_9CHLR|nr:hypothetical protein KDW_30640 [Dictyobacter vulcani]